MPEIWKLRFLFVLFVSNSFGTVFCPSFEIECFVFKNLDCTGGEASIFDCPLSGEWNEDCDASKKAGVQCASSKLLKTRW